MMASTIQQLKEIGESLGLKGTDLANFITGQQNLEREEREKQRERERKNKEKKKMNDVKSKDSSSESKDNLN